MVSRAVGVSGSFAVPRLGLSCTSIDAERLLDGAADRADDRRGRRAAQSAARSSASSDCVAACGRSARSSASPTSVRLAEQQRDDVDGGQRRIGVQLEVHVAAERAR